MKNSKGFTLIELMITLVSIGILATIAIPQFQMYKNEAKYKHIYEEMLSTGETKATNLKSWLSTHSSDNLKMLLEIYDIRMTNPQKAEQNNEELLINRTEDKNNKSNTYIVDQEKITVSSSQKLEEVEFPEWE